MFDFDLAIKYFETFLHTVKLGYNELYGTTQICSL